jgi:hypothetical protein
VSNEMRKLLWRCEGVGFDRGLSVNSCRDIDDKHSVYGRHTTSLQTGTFIKLQLAVKLSNTNIYNKDFS